VSYRFHVHRAKPAYRLVDETGYCLFKIGMDFEEIV
jgi:hypothetical protein